MAYFQTVMATAKLVSACLVFLFRKNANTASMEGMKYTSFALIGCKVIFMCLVFQAETGSLPRLEEFTI